MQTDEWARLTDMVNIFRNHGVNYAEVELDTFSATVKIDKDGFELNVNKVKGRG